MIQTLGGIALLLPLLSALTSPAVPIELRILLVALWVGAIVRPQWAIALLALLVPFAAWLLLILDAPPVRYAEALVLATLSGTLIAARRPRRTAIENQPPPLAPAALVFCAIVVASAAVMLQVMQAGTHAPWPFLRGFLVFLTHDYLVGPPGSFIGVAHAALLIEGVGLVLVVARHAGDGVVRPPQIFAVTALAGAAAALLTIGDLLITASSGATVGDVVRRLFISRTSVHVPDVNAAGSYFTMVGFVALALTLNVRWSRTPRLPGLVRASGVAASALLFVGVWLTGSRMAVVAAIGTLGMAALTVGPLHPRRWPRWAVAAGAVAGALALAALAVGLDPRPSAARTASHMLSMRGDFIVTGLRMIASAPAFGVGIGRYFEMSGRFMPSSIYWFYFHENAHNNFLQIGGELGLLGLIAFCWLLIVPAIRLVRGILADPDDRLLIGALAGLGAFAATWMTSHPLLVAEVGYPFWILLGAALARADGDAQPPLGSPKAIKMRVTRSNAAVVIVAAALVVSVPLRARREIAQLDFGKQSFGFYDWEEQNGQRFRWTSRRATFFIPLSARELRLPLRASRVGRTTAFTEVSIAIGGHVFHRVELAEDDWVIVHLRLPLTPDDESYQRIDIIVEPTWSPAAVFGGRTDVRVLGVQVGELFTGP